MVTGNRSRLVAGRGRVQQRLKSDLDLNIDLCVPAAARGSDIRNMSLQPTVLDVDPPRGADSGLFPVDICPMLESSTRTFRFHV